MRSLVAKAGPPASDAGGRFAADILIDGKSAVDDGDWFSDAAQQLFPSKAGTALHYATGFDERICQRYAAGHVRPPAYFLRSLLRGDQGWTWLCVVMQSSDQKWWRDVRFAVECASAFEAKRQELECSVKSTLPNAATE